MTPAFTRFLSTDLPRLAVLAALLSPVLVMMGHGG